MPSSPGHACAMRSSSARSNTPAAECETTPCGAPPALIRRVKARVSMPDRPMRACRFIQPSSRSTARNEDGAVTSSRTIMPSACGWSASTSSGLAPTLPIWGKVKVMICPANEGSVMIS